MSEQTRETRDTDGYVLCCHGRPISCLECGEDYAKELNIQVDRAAQDLKAENEMLRAALGELLPLVDRAVRVLRGSQ